MSQDALQRAENNFEHVVIVPDDVGQPLNALDDNEQPIQYDENRAVNDQQQL